MAIINSLAIGKARGSAGNLTYATIEGRTIARSRVTSVRNPNTAAQQLQRGSMALVVKLYRSIGSVCSRTFTVRKKYTSVYNQFVSMNIHRDLSFKWDEIDEDFNILFGLAVGNGSIPNSALKLECKDMKEASISIVDQNLLNSLKVGDSIGLFFNGPAKMGLESKSVTLDAEDIGNLRNGLAIDVYTHPLEFGAVAAFYISADGRKSNSPVTASAEDFFVE